ncbi:MAG: SAF domain-containing protein [Bifidobacteriaceae bacterium]|jgi:Flp pilus assembly protein CpaB|nr:SAF domain-containing protein [Bifidobacteriaceae bacterium]
MARQIDSIAELNSPPGTVRVARSTLAEFRAVAWRHKWLAWGIVVLLGMPVIVPGIAGFLRPTMPVLVTARQVAAGEVFEDGSLRLVKLDRNGVPDGALTSPDEALGARSAANLPAGYPLAPSLISPAGALAGAPPGTVAIPVRLSDGAAVGVLSPGDQVDVLAAAGTTAAGAVTPAQRVAASALVLAIPTGERAEPGLVVLAVTPTEATMIGGAAAWSTLSAVVVK